MTRPKSSDITAKIETMRLALLAMTDDEFLQAGGGPFPICPMAMWHRQIVIGLNGEVIKGNAYCLRCREGTCAAFTPCDLHKGKTNGCHLAKDCECAMPWNHGYKNQARLDAFRAWVDGQLRTMVQERGDRITRQAAAERHGIGLEAAIWVGTVAGSQSHNGITARARGEW
jgi:hypothetical protein